MPIPSRNKKTETPDEFMQRCMGDEVMKKEFPTSEQRVAVCMSKAIEGMSHIEAADFTSTYGKRKYKYKNPNTNEYYFYSRKGIYKKDGITLVPDFDEED
jgi:hypothetical protein